MSVCFPHYENNVAFPVSKTKPSMGAVKHLSVKALVIPEAPNKKMQVQTYYTGIFLT